MTHLYVFGDNVVQGSWDPFGGWVQRVRSVLDEHYLYDPEKRFLTFNMGVSGNSSANVLTRFVPEMEARYEENADLIILFAVGLNDSMMTSETGTHNVSEADFEKNLHKLYQAASHYTDKIGFVGLYPINEAEVNPLPWARDRAYWFNAVHSYNAIIKTFCARQDIFFIDIWKDWAEEPYEDWLFDGVHPNAAGHQKIARAVLKQFLKPLGWAVPPAQEGGFVTAS